MPKRHSCASCVPVLFVKKCKACILCVPCTYLQVRKRIHHKGKQAMKLRRTTQIALAAMLAITLTGLTAHAQQLRNAPVTSAQDLNLTDAQVFKIQALLMSGTVKMRRLSQDVLTAEDTLSAAIAKGDPALTAIAVLSLDAAEKA